MSILALLNQLYTPLVHQFGLPENAVGMFMELTLLGSVLLLASMATLFLPRLYHNLPRLNNTLNKLLFPVALALGCWGFTTWLGLQTISAPIISTVGVVATLWAVWRLTMLLDLAPAPRRTILLVSVIMALLATGNYLRPFLAFLDQLQIPLGENSLSLLMVVQALLIFTGFSWGAVVVANWLEHSLEKQKLSPALATLLVKIFKITTLVLAFFITLNLMGINLASLAVFGGALGIGIGFGLRTVTSNFISGILLLLDKSIKPGDVISVDDQTFGQVKAMNTRYIVMRRRDGMEVLIPNETLMTNQVINWSFSNKAVRNQVEIGVSYDSDMEHVREILLTAVKTVNRVLEVPPPVCFIKEFGDSSVVFILRYWSNDPENGVTNLKGAVNMAVWKALQEADIHIPFPQRVLHFAEDNNARHPAKKKTGKA